MAEFDSAERVSTYLEEYDTDAMTGDRDKRMYLYYQLVNSMKRADRIDIIVSFLMESGVKVAEGSGPGNEREAQRFVFSLEIIWELRSHPHCI